MPEDESRNETQIKELGLRLKSIREAQGLSIADISQNTKIQKHYLSAIEEGDLDSLPKGPYVRSFVRQYCEYLSAADLWKSYDSVTKERKIENPIHASYEEKNYSDSPKVFKSRSFIWLYLLIVLSLITAGWITWQYRGEISDVATSPIDGGTKAPTPKQDASPVTVSIDAASLSLSGDLLSADQSVDLAWMDGKQLANPGVVSASKKATKEPILLSRPIRIIADNASVWIKISQGSTVFFEGIIKPGEFKEYEVGPNNPIRVRFGNPGKTSAVWNNATTTPVAKGKVPVTRFYWPDGRTTTGNKLP